MFVFSSVQRSLHHGFGGLEAREMWVFATQLDRDQFYKKYDSLVKENGVENVSGHGLGAIYQICVVTRENDMSYRSFINSGVSNGMSSIIWDSLSIPIIWMDIHQAFNDTKDALAISCLNSLVKGYDTRKVIKEYLTGNKNDNRTFRAYSDMNPDDSEYRNVALNVLLGNQVKTPVVL